MTLVIGAAVALGTCALFAYVGGRLARRAVEPSARLANIAFATWWFGAALVMLDLAAQTFLGLAGVFDTTIHLALLYAVSVPVAAALWGLFFYLAYIYTGRRALLAPITAAYVLFLLFEIYYFTTLGPYEVRARTWDVTAVSTKTSAGPLSAVFGILLGVPVVAAAIAYARLVSRAPSAEQRFRVRAVSSAFGLWFGAMLLGFMLGLQDRDDFTLVYELPGLVAGFVVLIAFHPPVWLKRKLAARNSSVAGSSARVARP
ncbi:MAG: hypothetical protein ACYDCK_07980 [Thermoplasmatota archaeon]